jgi:putative ABC transport system permease protein
VTWHHGWRPALRIARRESWRAKGRSLLVLFMIAVPVAGATAADVLITTHDISVAEGVETSLGNADALARFESGGPVTQQPDGQSIRTAEPFRGELPLPTAADIEAALGRPVPIVEVIYGEQRIDTGREVIAPDVRQFDTTSDLTQGLVRVVEGRLPTLLGEAAINEQIADLGISVGDELSVIGGTPLLVTGVANRPSNAGRHQLVLPPGSLSKRDRYGSELLIGGGPVSWDDVQALNRLGGVVHSRAVLADPPPARDWPDEYAVDEYADQGGQQQVAVAVALAVIMAIMQIALLAGPALAMGAKRQARTIALVRIAGGSRTQARRVVMGGAFFLGVAGAVVGLVVGLLAAALVVRFVTLWGSWGPFDVYALHLVGFVVVGVVSSLIAAFMPARIAARQAPAAMLRGHPAAVASSPRLTVLGVVVLAAGVAASAGGAWLQQATLGGFLVAGAVVLLVVGMILVLPAVLSGVARWSGNAPLPMRYAIRDATRHLTRTVPAVAAVAGTVLGVVTIGATIASAEKAQEFGNAAAAPVGTGSVLLNDPLPGDWQAVTAVVEERLPGALLEPVTGSLIAEDGSRDFDVLLDEVYFSGSVGSLTSVGPLVSDGELPQALLGASESLRDEVRLALESGDVVVFGDRPVLKNSVAIRIERYEGSPPVEEVAEEVVLSATFVEWTGGQAPTSLVVPPSALDDLGLEAVQAGLLVSGTDVSSADVAAIRYAAQKTLGDGSFYVERGYSPEPLAVPYAVMAGVVGLVMLVGTVTATSLALADARNDLALLSAVGASPRRRRVIAAAYAWVIAVGGAVAGVVLGLVTGLSNAYQQAHYWVGGERIVSTEALVVPWVLVVAILVALPLLSAAIAALVVRPNVALTTRLE